MARLEPMAVTSSSVGLGQGHTCCPARVARCFRGAACPYLLRGSCWFEHDDDLKLDPPAVEKWFFEGFTELSPGVQRIFWSPRWPTAVGRLPCTISQDFFLRPLGLQEQFYKLENFGWCRGRQLRALPLTCPNVQNLKK